MIAQRLRVDVSKVRVKITPPWNSNDPRESSTFGSFTIEVEQEAPALTGGG